MDRKPIGVIEAKKEEEGLNCNCLKNETRSFNRAQIEEAASIIDEQGIPNNYVCSQYYVVVNGKEYPFKHLVRCADELVTLIIE